MKGTLRRASFAARVFSGTTGIMALWAVLGGGQPAYATHFRYGHINWAPVTGNTVQFTIQNSFRRSFQPGDPDLDAYRCIDPATLATVSCSAADGLPGPGDVFQEYIGFTRLCTGSTEPCTTGIGDIGNENGLLYVVTSIDPVNQWLFAFALDPASLPAIDTTITHTYPSAGNFTAAIDSGDRIRKASPNFHINNAGGGYRVETLVNAGTGNSSPVSALPPIVLCPVNGVCSFTVPGADPDGDPLHFRLSTAAEASSNPPDESPACQSTFCQPGPPFPPFGNAASISSAGVYTWDTTGATLGPAGSNTLYSTQVTIEDLDAAGNVKSKVAVDFLIQLVSVEVCGDGIDNNGDGQIDEDCNPPVFDNPVCGSTTTVNAGGTLSFTVQASDPDSGQTVTLNVAGLPAGATMTPPLPASGNHVTSVFSWTPTAADVGTHVITFTATDNSGLQAGLQTLCSSTLVVAPATKCPLTLDSWKTHHKDWPVTSLKLGTQSYTQKDLLTILRTPGKCDASWILAQQLIAAKLSIANGSDSTPVADTIQDADSLLAGFCGRLAYNVKTSSKTGKKMVKAANVLDNYNNGRLTPNCGHKPKECDP